MPIGDTQLHYETVESRARPPRVAILTDSSDTDWRHTVARIVELLSSVWGGNHSVIVPTDGSTIEPIFWSILEKFSPDYVYYYAKTGADIQISQPDEYAALLKSKSSGYDDEITKTHIDQDLRSAYVSRFGLNAELCSQIADRLVPFHFNKHFEPVFGHGHLPHQLTGIVDVLRYVDHPASFCCFLGPPEIDPVCWVGRTGACSAALSAGLRNLGLKEKTTRVSLDDWADFARWIAGGEVNAESQALGEVVGGRSKFIPPDQMHPTPFDVSMSATAFYASASSFRDARDRFAFVFGDGLADFCLSYCLSRVGYPAVYIPFNWLEQLQSRENSPLRSILFSIAYSVPFQVRCGPGFKACSVSQDVSKMRDAMEILKKHTGLGMNDEKLETVEAMSVLASAVPAPIPYSIDTPNQSEVYPFLGDRSVGPIRTPKPTGFSRLNAAKHRWVAEVIAGGRSVPTAPHVAESLMLRTNAIGGAVDARVSHQALAYVCPGSFLIIGEDIHPNLRHSEIRLFDTFTAISSIAEANNYTCNSQIRGSINETPSRNSAASLQPPSS